MKASSAVGSLPCVLLQQKKSQKGNWEISLSFSFCLLDIPQGYNKRNPKKGIESCYWHYQWIQQIYGHVTTKEIPKRELRAWFDNAALLTDRYRKVTTKEIPKRELREGSPLRGGKEKLRIVASELQQKKSQKGNWELQKWWRRMALRERERYNKRNPKKGIESLLHGRIWPQSPLVRLQQKKSQKGNWEGTVSSLRLLTIPFTLQQKKSQKGNWEPAFAVMATRLVGTGYNKRNPKKGIEEWWKVG